MPGNLAKAIPALLSENTLQKKRQGLEIKLRVGVNPLNVTLQHVFLTSFSVYTHKE